MAGRIGFWQLLLDDKISYWERNAINGAYDVADLAAGQASAAAFNAARAQQRIDQLSREIVMLRAAVTVLVNTLRDTGVVDARLLDARLEAALEEATAPPQQAPQPAPAQTFLICLRCREQKPASTTTMTADGPMCDPCAVRA
jgi:hypothetical protein